MRITPFAVLEQHAREEYRKRFASVPEPRILNAHASVSYASPRDLSWGGVGYWAPPLSYEDGNRLLAVASYLHDALRQGKEPAALDAQKTAVTYLRRDIDVTYRPGMTGILCRRRVKGWRARLIQAAAAQDAFLSDEPAETEALLRWLLYVEDESPLVPNDRRATVDLIDNQYAFEDRFKREPRSWRDYVYGMRYIARQSSREDLRGAVATRIGVNADAKTWRDYERDLRAVAGW